MQQPSSTPADLQWSIFINAPQEKIFALIQDPNNLPGLFPGLNNVTLITDGFEITYSPQIAGLTVPLNIPMTVSFTNVQSPTAITYASTQGGFLASMIWTLQTQDSGTLVTANATYQLSNTVLNSLLNFLVNFMGVTASAFYQGLTNLKTMSESNP